MAEEIVTQQTETTPEANPAPKASDAVSENTETKTTETQTETKNTNEPDKGQTAEPELTLESYGDLGLVETEDFKINPELNKSFKEIALKHKISPEAAKEIAALQYAQVKKDVDNLKAIKKGWEEENVKTYGDNLKNVETKCGRVLAEFDKDGKFQSFLSLVGAEKAPAILGFLNGVGDVLLEKETVNPGTKQEKRNYDLSELFE